MWMFDIKVQRGLFGPEREEVTRGWKNNCIMTSCMI